MVGLTGLLAYKDNPPLVTQEELREIRDRRERIYRAQLVTVFALAVHRLRRGEPFPRRRGRGGAGRSVDLRFAPSLPPRGCRYWKVDKKGQRRDARVEW